MYIWDTTVNRICWGPSEATTLAAAKKEVGEAIDDYGIVLRAAYVGKTSPFEAASWPIKLDEAKKNAGPLIETEATKRGITKAEMVAKIIQKADAYAQLEAAIAGNAGFHHDVLDSLTDMDAVLEYDWTGGWPPYPNG